MKRMITKLAAFALICTMLTGCASGSRRSRDDDDDDDTDKTEATSETSEEPAETSETPAHTEKSEPTTTTTEGTTAATSGTTADAGDLTLEEAINKPEIKKQFDDQIASLLSNPRYSSVYSNIGWKAEGNTLTYEYYYAQDYTKDQIKQIKSSIEGQKSTLLTAIATAKDGCEQSFGIRPEEIAYVYYTKDGTEIVRIAE